MVPMAKIKIGFKAFDAHELLCHFIAKHANLYKQNNLQVELIDITFVGDDVLPEDIFQVSCAAALTSALKGAQQRIVFVATDRPFFWLYSAQAVESLQSLKGRRVATYAPFAPPHHFARMILQRAGIDPEHDVTLVPARDDVARLGLLASGNTDAAVISSATSPCRPGKNGLRELCFFGDQVRFPTTGLAVDAVFLQREPQLVETVVRVLMESLALLHSDPALAGDVLQQYFGVPAGMKDREAAFYDRYFTQNGRTTPEVAKDAVDSMRSALRISTEIEWKEIYDFSLLAVLHRSS